MAKTRRLMDYRGRKVGPVELIAMLEEHLDRGHPTVEQADDIRLIAKGLTKLSVPDEHVKGLTIRLDTIDRSRSAWAWDDLEDEVHLDLRQVIKRYANVAKTRGSINLKLAALLVDTKNTINSCE